MLLHRCVSMGSGWVGGWTDGRTHTSACWQCCELRVMQPPGMLDSPSPCPGAHLRSPSHRYPQHSAQRSEASLCAGMRGWAAPSLPRPGSPPLQPRSRPPPARISPRAVPAGPWKWGRTAPGAPTAGPSACCGHPAPAGLSLRGAWPRPPPRSGGSGWGGGGPSRAARTHHRSALGPVRLGSARPGSAPPGAGRCTQLRRSSGGRRIGGG